MPSNVDTTQVTMSAAAGDPAAAARLLPLVYDELRALAAGYMRREAPGQTIQATALVHEAYMKLVDHNRIDWKGKTHFFAVAATAMRRLLVDHARHRRAAKRGGDVLTITVHEGIADPSLGTAGATGAGHPAAPSTQQLSVVALDEALEELAVLNERQARVVELRFFAGLTHEETARALGVSERTVRGDWRVARAWLRHRLG